MQLFSAPKLLGLLMWLKIGFEPMLNKALQALGQPGMHTNIILPMCTHMPSTLYIPFTEIEKKNIVTKLAMCKTHHTKFRVHTVLHEVYCEYIRTHKRPYLVRYRHKYTIFKNDIRTPKPPEILDAGLRAYRQTC